MSSATSLWQLAAVTNSMPESFVGAHVEKPNGGGALSRAPLARLGEVLPRPFQGVGVGGGILDQDAVGQL